MKKILARHWFLITLLGCVSSSLTWPAHLAAATAWLDPRVVVITALFLMAWTMPTRSLQEELKKPGAALWAVVVSYGFLPAGAWFLGGCLPVVDFQIGTLISASSPSTLASAVLWTRLARGNEATALMVTFLCTASSWLVTTAWLTLTTGTTVALQPGAMMLDLVLSLILPVGLGQLCRRPTVLHKIATEHKFGLSLLSQILILAILVRASAQVGLRLRAGTAQLETWALLTAVAFPVILHLAALALGWWTSPCFGFDRPRQIAVAFACSQKTLPVALYLFNEYFQYQYPLGIISITAFHVGQLLCDTAIAEKMAGGSGEVKR